MQTTTNVRAGPPISFASADSMARALKLFTPAGARVRLVRLGGKTRDVQLVDVHESEDGISIDVIPYDPTNTRYISSHDRPAPEELERIELADLAELVVL